MRPQAFGVTLFALACLAGPDAGTAGVTDADREEVRAQLRKHHRELARCMMGVVEHAEPRGSVKMVLSFVIMINGRVSQLEVQADDLPGLHACLEADASRWRFRPRNAEARVTIPTVLDLAGP